MRKLLSILAFALLVTLASPAQAEPVSDAATGLNGVVTSVADPILGLRDGDQIFDFGPLNPLTDRITGLVTGTLTGLNRAVRGALDVPISVLPIEPLSPEARYTVVPGASE